MGADGTAASGMGGGRGVRDPAAVRGRYRGLRARREPSPPCRVRRAVELSPPMPTPTRSRASSRCRRAAGRLRRRRLASRRRPTALRLGGGQPRAARARGARLVHGAHGRAHAPGDAGEPRAGARASRSSARRPTCCCWPTAASSRRCSPRATSTDGRCSRATASSSRGARGHGTPTSSRAPSAGGRCSSARASRSAAPTRPPIRAATARCSSSSSPSGTRGVPGPRPPGDHDPVAREGRPAVDVARRQQRREHGAVGEQQDVGRLARLVMRRASSRLDCVSRRAGTPVRAVNVSSAARTGRVRLAAAHTESGGGASASRPPQAAAAEGDGERATRAGGHGGKARRRAPARQAPAPRDGSRDIFPRAAPASPARTPMPDAALPRAADHPAPARRRGHGEQERLGVLGRRARRWPSSACRYEARVVSAHRTPDWLFEYAEPAESRGLRAIIAGAGGAAHLPGMLAAKTLVPVLGVPVPATMLNGVDSLLSIVQMPAGVPVGTLAIGKPGAVNAALLAAQIAAPRRDPALRERLRASARRAPRRGARADAAALDARAMTASMRRDPSRRHDRHPRRRAARAHDRAWRRARWATTCTCSTPIPTCAARPVAARVHHGALRRRRRRGASWRAAATWSRSRSSRSRRDGARGRRGARAGAPGAQRALGDPGSRAAEGRGSRPTAFRVATVPRTRTDGRRCGRAARARPRCS